ncbi:MAG: ABC transporter substrate-binding protein [Desulfobulbaceae bacterium]|nr:ABC transporter substrate-binding protein [Desulfobulbaceae bacterium]
MLTLKTRLSLFLLNVLPVSRAYCPKFILTCIVFSLSCAGPADSSSAWPVRGTDSRGEPYVIDQRPRRVVSLVPEITEILIALDTTDALVGITKHTVAPEVAQKKVIGGFLSPEIERIEALNPDLILAADLHREVRDYFQDKCPLLTLNISGIEGAMERLALLGQIFEREETADRIIAKNRKQLKQVAQKVAAIPDDRRQRVIRLMGRDNLLVPGDNSFQNDFIRAAGAIAPVFGKKGQAVAITLEEWKGFDPQVVYVCGTGELPEILLADGVKEVSAVQTHRLYSFSCDLTCRAGVHIGNFVTLLAAWIYSGELADLARQVQSGKPANCVLDEK